MRGVRKEREKGAERCLKMKFPFRNRSGCRREGEGEKSLKAGRTLRPAVALERGCGPPAPEWEGAASSLNKPAGQKWVKQPP